jgi:hypothetical protein
MKSFLKWTGAIVLFLLMIGLYLFIWAMHGWRLG